MANGELLTRPRGRTRLRGLLVGTTWTRREILRLGTERMFYEHDADLSPVRLSDDRRTQCRKWLKQYLACVVIERWKRFVYKRKRSRSALQYLTTFDLFVMSRETLLANISEFM